MKKLFEVQKLMKKYGKDGKADHGKFVSKYLTLDKLLEQLLPTCNDFWLLIIHQMLDNKVITRVIDIETNVQEKSEFTVIASDPQKIWGAITYGKRYNLWQLFNISTDEDDDWNNASESTIKQLKKEVDEIENIEELRTYAKNNKWNGKEVDAYILSHSKKIWKSTT